MHVYFSDNKSVNVQMIHMSCLRELKLSSYAGIDAASVLPAGLTRLCVHGPIQVV